MASHRENARTNHLAASASGPSERTVPKLRKGDWVKNDNNERCPTFGRVTECWTDSLGTCATIRTYTPEGAKAQIEPAIPVQQLTRIEPPAFPLKLDVYFSYGHLLRPIGESER